MAADRFLGIRGGFRLAPHRRGVGSDGAAERLLPNSTSGLPSQALTVLLTGRSQCAGVEGAGVEGAGAPCPLGGRRWCGVLEVRRSWRLGILHRCHRAERVSDPQDVQPLDGLPDAGRQSRGFPELRVEQVRVLAVRVLLPSRPEDVRLRLALVQRGEVSQQRIPALTEVLLRVGL
ncbi:hypothetical protein BCY76_008370 [Nesterenkonia sp. PF2B19]|nr:hypothetical protein BCY76_008370 [Nesterenkonia sp. PF2B19]